MTNINDLGLPQGLPELPPGSAEWWSDFCRNRRSACQVYRTPEDDQFYDPSGTRLMTAEDLGLPLDEWDWEWLTDMYGGPRSPYSMWLNSQLFASDAPYSFWLGANA